MGTDLPFRVSGLFIAGIVNRKEDIRFDSYMHLKVRFSAVAAWLKHVCSPPLVGHSRPMYPNVVLFFTEIPVWLNGLHQRALLAMNQRKSGSRDMNVEFIIKALKIQMRRIEEAISAVEAVAEDEIQGRHDARENIRP
ncbi:MAG: hypothetical protein JWN34_4758 [Bryobacterales bacterium]|nr:hypothetical protein [Bryobacterales bacterium]